MTYHHLLHSMDNIPLLPYLLLYEGQSPISFDICLSLKDAIRSSNFVSPRFVLVWQKSFHLFNEFRMAINFVTRDNFLDTVSIVGNFGLSFIMIVFGFALIAFNICCRSLLIVGGVCWVITTWRVGFVFWWRRSRRWASKLSWWGSSKLCWWIFLSYWWVKRSWCHRLLNDRNTFLSWGCDCLFWDDWDWVCKNIIQLWIRCDLFKRLSWFRELIIDIISHIPIYLFG